MHVASLIPIYTKLKHQRRGSWSIPKIVLSVDSSSKTVTVSGNNGRPKKAAIEDIRLTTAGNELSRLIDESIDDMDGAIEETVDELNLMQDEPNLAEGPTPGDSHGTLQLSMDGPAVDGEGELDLIKDHSRDSLSNDLINIDDLTY